MISFVCWGRAFERFCLNPSFSIIKQRIEKCADFYVYYCFRNSAIVRGIEKKKYYIKSSFSHPPSSPSASYNYMSYWNCLILTCVVCCSKEANFNVFILFFATYSFFEMRNQKLQPPTAYPGRTVTQPPFLCNDH